jgi:hypothetical protein
MTQSGVWSNKKFCGISQVFPTTADTPVVCSVKAFVEVFTLLRTPLSTMTIWAVSAGLVVTGCQPRADEGFSAAKGSADSASVTLTNSETLSESAAPSDAVTIRVLAQKPSRGRFALRMYASVPVSRLEYFHDDYWYVCMEPVKDLGTWAYGCFANEDTAVLKLKELRVRAVFPDGSDWQDIVALER